MTMYCDRVRRARPLLGTLVEISLAGNGEEGLHRAAASAFDEIARIHELMSLHSGCSDLYRLNNAPLGSAVRVDARTWRVLDIALGVARASDGVFDVTIGASMMRRGDLPWMLNEAPDANATFRDVELVPDQHVRLHRRLAIDVGGVAKGYAVDRAVAVLQQCGVSAGCVNAGGDLRVFGEEAVLAQVRDPDDPTRIGARVDVQALALATSASYASVLPFVAAGAVLDPRNGQPAPSGRSATVRAPDCAQADALAKCLLLLGEACTPLLRDYRADGFLFGAGTRVVIDGLARASARSDQRRSAAADMGPLALEDSLACGVAS